MVHRSCLVLRERELVGACHVNAKEVRPFDLVWTWCLLCPGSRGIRLGILIGKC